MRWSKTGRRLRMAQKTYPKPYDNLPHLSESSPLEVGRLWRVESADFRCLSKRDIFAAYSVGEMQDDSDRFSSDDGRGGWRSRARRVHGVPQIFDRKGGTQKVGATEFSGLATTLCAVQLARFRNSLIANNVKAGWTRKKAEPDADLQIGDYLTEWSDRYRDLSSIAASK